MDPTFDTVFKSSDQEIQVSMTVTGSKIDSIFDQSIKVITIDLPTPILIEEYNRLPVKDPGTYYFILG